MLKIGVLVSGSGTNLQAIIEEIKNGNIKAEIVTVISNVSNAYALERARQNNIDAKFISIKESGSKEKFEEKVISYLKEKNVDLVVFAGFLVVLSSRFVNEFKNRIINIHPSLIPSFCGKGYYGLKVHQAALKKGVKITGATVHFVDEGTDTGLIILQKAVEVKDDDTPEILQKRVMEEAEWVILPKAIKLYSENKLIIKDNIVRRLG